MQKLVLAYHSVSGPAADAVLGSFPISLARFESQISTALDRGWRFGRVSEIWEPVRQKTLFITSDDGTVDWARNVLPWCEARGIPTHTALVSGPWGMPPVYPLAHRLQILLSLPDVVLPQPVLTEDQKRYIDKIYYFETDLRRRYLKGACNLVYDFRQALELLGPPRVRELELLSVRFAFPDAYRPFRHAEFGVHAVNHRAFDGDVEGYMKSEILACRQAIQAVGLPVNRAFTLPMRPRYPSTVDQLVQPLQDQGFNCLFEGPGKWNGSDYVIPRIDAKDVETQVFG